MTTGIDGGDLGTWQIIKPVAATNYVTNPSFETGTTGWTATSGSITRTAGVGVFGAYGGRLLATGTNGKAGFTCASVASGTQGVASAYIKAASASVQLKLTIGASSSTLAHPGDGAFHRLEIPITAPSTTTPVIEIIDTRSSAWTNVDIDGVQFETGVTAATTYADGDQDGCTWTGTSHGSNSSRDARDPRGGSLVSFTSLGLTEKTWGGIGAPDLDVATLTLALGDGEVYQSSTAKPRVITLAALAQASTLAALHAVRRALQDALDPDIRTNRGPVRLRYAGAATPKYIDVINESGLGFDKPYHQRAEMVDLRFLAPDPVWKGQTEESAVLTAAQSLSPTRTMALRTPDGTWSTLSGGYNFATGAAVPIVERLLDGRIVIGGNLTNVGGTLGNDYLVTWDGSVWASVSGANPNNPTNAAALGLDGTLYVAGTFTAIGGVAITRMAQWNPSTSTWTTVGPGGASAAFSSLTVDPATGYLWGAGNAASGPATAGGVAINGLGYWNGTTWVAANTGLPGTWSVGGPQGLIVGPDGRLLLANSGGTPGIYAWSGSAWSIIAATTGSPVALLSTNGRLYVGGSALSVIGGVTVANIAMTSGSGWSSMTGGTTTSVGTSVQTLARLPDGRITAAGKGWTVIGGITPPDTIATWNGSGWEPFSANPPDTATHANDTYAARSCRDGSILVTWQSTAGTFGTTLTAEAITSVTNSGSTNAYPVFTFDSSTALYSLANLTTGHRINFSGVTIASGEVATLDLRPGRKTFSAFLRPLANTILPGSDLSTFCLAPGVNQIAMYAAGGNNTMHWTDRFWGAD